MALAIALHHHHIHVSPFERAAAVAVVAAILIGIVAAFGLLVWVAVNAVRHGNSGGVPPD